MSEIATPLTNKDFSSDQEVRWCPGCGDYAILRAMQKALPQLEEKRENYDNTLEKSKKFQSSTRDQTRFDDVR